MVYEDVSSRYPGDRSRIWIFTSSRRIYKLWVCRSHPGVLCRVMVDSLAIQPIVFWVARYDSLRFGCTLIRLCNPRGYVIHFVTSVEANPSAGIGDVVHQLLPGPKIPRCLRSGKTVAGRWC